MQIVSKEEYFDKLLEHYNNSIENFMKNKKVYELLQLNTKDTRELAFKYVEELKQKLSDEIWKKKNKASQDAIDIGKYNEYCEDKNSGISVFGKLYTNIRYEKWSLFPHIHYFEVGKQ